MSDFQQALESVRVELWEEPTKFDPEPGDRVSFLYRWDTEPSQGTFERFGRSGKWAWVRMDDYDHTLTPIRLEELRFVSRPLTTGN